ncbi:hypothetical protein EDC65_0529 [Stella humosa]|uniref:TRAP transporter TAXI family solute receptor n=2 Tax=cellular organisms TaxID=131567 RepID=A0A3N1MC82_9PROT|nr:TAXI family TRAP transporter solute-binding subunit [Stella humosa]ROQ01351.1 hypothetical protein EDC65_0529 [Stella humosa]BBK31725.1 C4-dicarboxylate ABC transporter substrate-binding protein [Stella humosa]
MIGRSLLLAGIGAAMGIAGPASAQTIEFVAGQLGGGWYTMSSGMAKMMQDKNPGLTIKVVPGGGTANPSKIQQGQSQLGMGLDIFSKMAREGTGVYAGRKHDKVVMIGQSFSDNYVHFIKAQNAPYTFEDVFKQKNVKIGVTKAGSSDEMTYRFVMEEYGQSYDKLRANGWKIVQGDYNELASSYKDGQVDYVFLVLGIPGAAVIDMGTGRKGELMTWPKTLSDTLVSKYGYSPATFPKATYPSFQNADVSAILMATTLMASSDLSDDIAYKVAKTLCENTAELPKIHASMDVYKCETAVKIQPVPVHPGAMKYYKEKGFGS